MGGLHNRNQTITNETPVTENEHFNIDLKSGTHTRSQRSELYHWAPPVLSTEKVGGPVVSFETVGVLPNDGAGDGEPVSTVSTHTSLISHSSPSPKISSQHSSIVLKNVKSTASTGMSYPLVHWNTLWVLSAYHLRPSQGVGAGLGCVVTISGTVGMAEVGSAVSGADVVGADVIISGTVGAAEEGSAVTGADVEGASVIISGIVGAADVGATEVGSEVTGDSVMISGIVGASEVGEAEVGSDVTGDNVVGDSVIISGVVGASEVGAAEVGAEVIGAMVGNSVTTSGTTG